MKFLSLAVPTLLATSVSARATFFSSSDVSPNDSNLKVPGDNPVEHCQDPADDILAIKSIDLSPNPPEAGKTLTVTANGILAEDVEEGAIAYLTVKLGLITLIKQEKDLCELVKEAGLECPLKKGPIKIVKDVDLPKEIPPAKFTAQADLVTKDNDKITCVKATVDFGHHSLFKQDM